MLILAFDTATPAVTVAVHDGVQVVAEESAVDARRHGELLSVFIDQALHSAGATPASLTAIAVGTGPGPYTGLRTGLVTARVLGATLGVPVDGICTLDVIAASAAGAAGGREFLVATDARRKELYWARYSRLRAAGHRAGGQPGRRPAAGLPVAGEGARLYPELVEQALEPGLPVRGLAGRAGRRADRGRDAPGAAAAALPAPARRQGAGPAQAGDPVTTPGPAAGPAPAVLRVMTAADLDAVLGLELELFGEEAWSRPMLEGELAQVPGSRHYLVAEQDGQVVGYAGPAGRGHPGRRGHHRGHRPPPGSGHRRGAARGAAGRGPPPRLHRGIPGGTSGQPAGPAAVPHAAVSSRSASGAATTSRPAPTPW